MPLIVKTFYLASGQWKISYNPDLFLALRNNIVFKTEDGRYLGTAMVLDNNEMEKRLKIPMRGTPLFAALEKEGSPSLLFWPTPNQNMVGYVEKFHFTMPSEGN